MTNTSADVWLLYTEEHLHKFITALGLDATQATTKEDKAELLATLPNITPNEALQALLAHQQAAFQAAQAQHQPPTTNEVKLQLTKQAANERPEDFIDRARTHFDLVEATDTQAITLLVNAALPPIAAFITQNYRTGTTTIEPMLQLISTRFAPNKYQYYDQFRRFRLTKGQSAQDAGNELRRLFLGFLNLPADQITTGEAVIKETVTAQLLDTLPPNTAATLRTELLRQPTMSWTDILKHADQLLQSTPHTTTSDKAKSRNQLYCSIHGYAGHANADCQAQLGHRANSSKPTPGTSNRPAQPPTCFSCGKEGHMATHCPTTRHTPQGNC
jgi:hypothetical protein